MIKFDLISDFIAIILICNERELVWECMKLLRWFTAPRGFKSHKISSLQSIIGKEVSITLIYSSDQS